MDEIGVFVSVIGIPFIISHSRLYEEKVAILPKILRNEAPKTTQKTSS